MQDQIAIMMATFNGETYLREQIESILGQTYPNWILYINDDGSTDGTGRIIEEYQREEPERIQYLVNQSQSHGATANFVDLFEKTPQTDYYVFCDQDDVWEPDKLDKMLTRMKEEEHTYEGPLLLYCRMRITDQELHPLCESLEEYIHLNLGENDHLRKLLLANYVPGCAMMFNHQLKKEMGNYPDGIQMHDWWIMLVAAAIGKIVRLQDPALANYRQHLSNTIGVKNTQSTVSRIVQNLSPENFKKHANRIREGRRESIRQGYALLERYPKQLSYENRKTIEELLKLLQTRNKIKSIQRGFAYDYCGNTCYEKFTFWWFTVGRIK